MLLTGFDVLMAVVALSVVLRFVVKWCCSWSRGSLLVRGLHSESVPSMIFVIVVCCLCDSLF